MKFEFIKLKNFVVQQLEASKFHHLILNKAKKTDTQNLVFTSSHFQGFRCFWVLEKTWEKVQAEIL
jgi:hypothetical protein